MQISYYDDNYGHWDNMDDPDQRDFFAKIQRTNVKKKCEGCGRSVSIQPQYAYCNSCAEKREQGWDI